MRSVGRTPTGIEIRDDADDLRTFDAAVVATHADDALRLLAAPTPPERATLGAFASSVNETIMHTDASVLPDADGGRGPRGTTCSTAARRRPTRCTSATT